LLKNHVPYNIYPWFTCRKIWKITIKCNIFHSSNSRTCFCDMYFVNTKFRTFWDIPSLTFTYLSHTPQSYPLLTELYAENKQRVLHVMSKILLKIFYFKKGSSLTTERYQFDFLNIIIKDISSADLLSYPLLPKQL
jgi:hypothetical protein